MNTKSLGSKKTFRWKAAKKELSRKTRRRGTALFLLIALPLLLSGCRKVTPEGLLKAAAENARKASSFKGSMKMDVGMGVRQSGISASIDMKVDMDVEATSKPQDYHMKGTLSSELTNASIDMEMYGKESKDGLSTVTYTKMLNEWTKSEQKNTEKNSGPMMDVGKLIQKDSRPVLQKKLGKMGGKDVYVVKTSVENFGEAGGAFDDFINQEAKGIDLSNIHADVVIKIYKDNCLPASISMVMKDGSGKAVSKGKDDMGIALDSLKFAMKFTEYNTVDKIKLPGNALYADEENSNSADSFGGKYADELEDKTPNISKDEDGNYIVTDTHKDKKVKVTPPANMKLNDYSDEYSISFRSTDREHHLTAQYMVSRLSDSFSEQDLINTFQYNKKYYADDPNYNHVELSDVKTFKAGEHELKYMTLSNRFKDGDYNTQCMSWYITKDGYALSCHIRESLENQPKALINEQLISKLMSCINE